MRTFFVFPRGNKRNGLQECLNYFFFSYLVDVRVYF